jgi:hypothetical protein
MADAAAGDRVLELDLEPRRRAMPPIADSVPPNISVPGKSRPSGRRAMRSRGVRSEASAPSW